MTAAASQAGRFRRAGVAVAAAALVAMTGGLPLAAAAPLSSQVTPSATGADASALVAISPTRALDTRASSGGPIGVTTASPLGPGETLELKLTAPGPLPVDAVGAVLNVTLDDATAKSFVTVWPSGEPRPLASTNNAEPGLITPNSMIAKLGINGSVNIFNAAGSTHVVIDVVGYLVPMQNVAVIGPQFLVGTTAPAATLGQLGDTYFDSVTQVLYGPKGPSGWGQPSSLTGDQGPVGPAGAAGGTGATGATGTARLNRADRPPGSAAPMARRVRPASSRPTTATPTWQQRRW